jgi:hypothetical protein
MHSPVPWQVKIIFGLIGAGVLFVPTGLGDDYGAVSLSRFAYRS